MGAAQPKMPSRLPYASYCFFAARLSSCPNFHSHRVSMNYLRSGLPKATLRPEAVNTLFSHCTYVRNTDETAAQGRSDGYA